MKLMLTLVALVCLLTAASCERERRQFQSPTASSSTAYKEAEQNPVHPGGKPPLKGSEAGSSGGGGFEPYHYNAYGVSEGQKLYMSFNCVGCHAHGGGGIGPPLMDANWIYGGEPQNIHDSIVEGRPNGMPSFRGRIADYQVWELVAYVRSMSGQLPPTVAPGRSDEMNIKKPEQVTPGQPPKQ